MSDEADRSSDAQTSDFGWWARFESNYGDFGWIESSFRRPGWKYTEDPEKAYRFATKADAEAAIALMGIFQGGAWAVVEHKDEGLGDDRNEDHAKTEIERSERVSADAPNADAEQQEIDQAHPLRTGRHDLYAEAMRLVGARHAKGDLVELVNMLLHRSEGLLSAIEQYTTERDAQRRESDPTRPTATEWAGIAGANAGEVEKLRALLSVTLSELGGQVQENRKLRAEVERLKAAEEEAFKEGYDDGYGDGADPSDGYKLDEALEKWRALPSSCNAPAHDAKEKP